MDDDHQQRISDDQISVGDQSEFLIEYLELLNYDINGNGFAILLSDFSVLNTHFDLTDSLFY